LPTEPGLALIDPTMIQCFYGAKENGSACPLISRKAEIILTAGGHHFDTDYSALDRGILDGRHRLGE
jgi:type IV secretory pathway VirJ component